MQAIKWDIFPDTLVYGGTGAPNSGTSASACLDDCAADLTCTGVDWDPAYPENNRCFKHAVFGTKNSGPGVTHYDIIRTCGGTLQRWNRVSGSLGHRVSDFDLWRYVVFLNTTRVEMPVRSLERGVCHI